MYTKMEQLLISFDWGDILLHEKLMMSLMYEIFVLHVYNRYFNVDKNDIVVDVGASIGPFSYSILDKNPKHIYCIEPSRVLFETLEKNLGTKKNVTLINKGIATSNTKSIMSGLYNHRQNDKNHIFSTDVPGGNEAPGITFRRFLETYDIKKIDFLKSDCEGGEYHLFTRNNFDWIKNNVRKIAAEFHLVNPYQRKEWIDFRDLYLSSFKNYKVCTPYLEDITDKFRDGSTLEMHTHFYVFIDNR
jgi:FkbM family methyltransferase